MIRSSKFVRIGDTITWYGVTYKCVKRPPVDRPMDACKGCDLGRIADCAPFQCSRFDRSDNTNVWFKTL